MICGIICQLADFSGKKHDKNEVENTNNIAPVSGCTDRYKIKSHLQNGLVVKKFINILQKQKTVYKSTSIFKTICRNNTSVYMA